MRYSVVPTHHYHRAMAQSDAGLPEAIDQPSEDENATPVASGPHHDSTCDHDDDGTHAKESQEPADSSPDISEEIQAVKMKILELEQSARKLPVSRDSEAQLLVVTEQHRRMEACLYKHRKEWETTIGPGYWSLQPDVMKTTRTFTPYGPWNRHWRIKSKNDYVRPNPFDPSHQCAVDPDDIEASVTDGFDRTIDYGARRDRARKAFEWEMDRLYLAEEIEMERRKGGVRPPVPLKPYGPISEDTESRINRLEWFSFQQMGEVGRPGGCVVEVLEGEPIVDDGIGGYHRWYATSGRRDRKAKGIQGHKAFESMPSGQAPLPERIRIRSNALLRIISTILGEDQPPYTSSTVMIRPFKMLIVCERELREWYAALERKFSANASMRKGSTNFAIGPDSIRSPEAFSAIEPEKIDGKSETQNNSAIAKPSVDALEFTGVAQTAHASEDQSTSFQNVVDDQVREEDHEKEQDESDEEGGEGPEDDTDDLTRSPMALEHLRCLLSFVDMDIEAKRTYLKSEQCRKVFFSDLWLLFLPGTEVIGNDGKQAYRVMNVAGPRHQVCPGRSRWVVSSDKELANAPFSIICVYIDFDGKNLGPVLKVFDFRNFDGERDVISFEVYPLRFYPAKQSSFNEREWEDFEAVPERDRYRHKLIQRGSKFLSVAEVKHMYYAGPTLEMREDVESQVVVDFETAFSVKDNADKQWKPELLLFQVVASSPKDALLGVVRNDECNAECCRGEWVYNDSLAQIRQREDYANSLLPRTNAVDELPPITIGSRPLKELRTSPDGNFVLSEEELLIMSYRVFGFVLRSRKWDLAHLTDVNMEEIATATSKDGESERRQGEKGTLTAFDRLVLEKGHRDMIVSLVSQHFRDKESRTGKREEFDIVQGKGDLGTTAKEVEKALETNFALASKWDCILLLDEADVFLAQRTKEDFKRNGLVAAFLRVMEYYAGILFLTTNRVGDFDEAFTSRIHISLYYPELNEEKTVEVFTINMDMIQKRFNDSGRTIKIDRVAIGGFATGHFAKYDYARWNGRQIRNACQTALALAEFEAQGSSHTAILKPDAVVELEKRHFEIVRDAYLEFTKYMDDIYGTNPRRRAKEAHLRAMRLAETGGVSGGSMSVDSKAAFARASQAQPQYPPQLYQQMPYSHHSQSVPSQGIRLQSQQPQPYNPYQNFNVQRPDYPGTDHMRTQQQSQADQQYWRATWGSTHRKR
ncbi:hypothetical protein SLS54_000504 [Diplodia seriata]